MQLLSWRVLKQQYNIKDPVDELQNPVTFSLKKQTNNKQLLQMALSNRTNRTAGIYLKSQSEDDAFDKFVYRFPMILAHQAGLRCHDKWWEPKITASLKWKTIRNSNRIIIYISGNSGVFCRGAVCRNTAARVFWSKQNTTKEKKVNIY